MGRSVGLEVDGKIRRKPNETSRLGRTLYSG